MKFLPFILIFSLISIFCNHKQQESGSDIKTRNVVIVVIDGARYSETFGDPEYRNIPNIANRILPAAVMNTNFYNRGSTVTVAGHAAITTGHYCDISNSGDEFPPYPSVFQYYNCMVSEKGATNSALFTSKDKLHVLSDCSDEDWAGRCKPYIDCGNSGPGSGYRKDELSCQAAISYMKKNKPGLLLINFREPDYSGHTADSTAYIRGIMLADSLTGVIWSFLNSDSHYQGKTTLIITNDHGRHSDGVGSGFSSHGCSCEGCSHLMFCAAGPDFPDGVRTNQPAELTDIAPTIAMLLNFRTDHMRGRVMHELFIRGE